jgi:hypothetical protein
LATVASNVTVTADVVGSLKMLPEPEKPFQPVAFMLISIPL